MIKNKKITLFAFLTIFIIFLSIILYYNSLPDLTINICKGRHILSDYEINGILYFIRSDGVYKVEECQMPSRIININCDKASIYISLQDEMIYIFEYNKNILNQYDLNGSIKNTFDSFSFDNFEFYKVDNNIIIGKQKNGIDTYKFVKYDLKNRLQNSTINIIEYDNDDISFCILKNEVLNYSFKSQMTDFIGINNSYISYMNEFYHPEIYIIDFLNNIETKIELYSYISNGYYVSGCLNDNTISVSVTNTSSFFFDKTNVHGDISTLKYHNYDLCIFIDSKSGKIKNQHKFSKFERILYVDNEKAITYYNGKYLFYDLDNWDLMCKLSADEIKNGGSYTFESCGDYIFVFDDNTGELINRISIDF